VTAAGVPPLPPTPIPPPPRGGAWNLAPRLTFQGGHSVSLLRGGDALFPAMIAAIDAAQRQVWLATYIFHDDDDARALALALAAAARRGVRVRLVVDGFGSKATLPVLRDWLADSGAELAVFRPIDRWWRWFSPGQLRRLHQKLCVVDGAIAFVGGVNLIADRLDLRHGWSDAPRLDFAVSLRGAAVAQVMQTAQAMWTRAALGRVWRDEVLALTRSAAPLANLRGLAQRLRQSPPLRRAPADDAPLPPTRLAFVVRDNLRQRRAIERAYIEAINRARERVDLVTPYFYPGRAFRRALGAAARRGVRVRLLLQGKIDYRLAGLAARVLYDEMLANGIEIHEYTAAYLHAKVGVVDGRWCTVGSSNIDPLSLLLNLEANVVVQDDDFAGELGRALDEAMAGARRVTAPPYATGALAVLRRGFVAGLARWFLRMAGLSGKY